VRTKTYCPTSVLYLVALSLLGHAFPAISIDVFTFLFGNISEMDDRGWIHRKETKFPVHMRYYLRVIEKVKLHLVSMLRMLGVSPPFSIYAYITW
jgi:hypothetical protein